MGILVQNEWRNRAIFATIILMLASLLVSRAFLSISLIAFAALTMLHDQLYTQLKRFLASPFLISLSLLFFIPLISGLWSEDMHEWGKVLLVKLPFVVLPVSFAGQWQLKEKEWNYIAYCFVAFTVAACCWSAGQYLFDIQSINESYLRAKTIPTPLDDDHVRFSWLVSLAVITIVLLLDKFPVKRKAVLMALLVIPVVYLHLLSARTGLMMLYVFGLAFALYKARKKPRLSLLIIAALAILLLTGWFCFPTFQNRIRYNLYDLSFVVKDKYMSGSSDGNRVISLKAGWHLLQQDPLTGVGAGDLRNETNHWYDANVPGIKETDKLYPSSEWIIYGGMAGWPGLLLFTAIILFPLYIKNIRHRFFWIMLHVVAMLGFTVETSLEMQHGVFIYTFFILWWWKWLGKVIVQS
jgi:O-antigen ligase